MMNPFKKYCVSFVILSVVCLAIHPLLFYANLGIEDAPARAMDNWFKIKEGYVRTHSGRKLFILGCSETLFGVDASLMEQELGIHAVNFGVTMPLRKYVFDRVRASLSSGDMVLITLHYGMYQNKLIPQENVVYIMEYDKSYFDKMPVVEKVNSIYSLRTSFLLWRTIVRTIGNEYGDDEPIYSSKNLNSNGDLTINSYETRTYRKPKVPAALNLGYDKAPNDEMSQILSDFARYCDANNIELYVTWPPSYPETGKKEFYGHEAQVVQSIAKFWEANNVQVLGDYRDALFETDYMYDFPSHLNDRGKAIYTRHLIELLRPYI